MLKSMELQAKLEIVKDEIKALQSENKVEEAHSRLKEIENLKKEIEVAKSLEEEEIENVQNVIENRKEVVDMQKFEQQEIKEFENYVRNRGIQNEMKQGANGAIIPTSIANMVIEKVKEISPIYSMATVFHSAGKLVFPLENNIPTTNYVDEGATISDSDATFTTVELGGYLASALTKISESLIANASFDIVTYVVNAMAKSISVFLEKELLKGTSSKCTGALSTENKVTTTSASAVTADDLIDVQMLVPQSLQDNCCWIMHPSTLKSLRKLKDGQGNYLMGNMTNGFGYTLLNKPIYLSENIDTIGASADVILYGDLTGLYVNIPLEINTKILAERYADQNAIGVKANFMVDAKIVETQKLAKVTMGE